MSSNTPEAGQAPPISPQTQLVVVLGMHRSGTSALTRALPVLGIELGDNLLPPVEGNNPTGFWEEREIYDLHNQMFGSAGRDWDDLEGIGASELRQWLRQGYFHDAVALLRAKTAGKPWYGLKDPRMSALLPFWQMVFAECAAEVHYLLSFRNPLSVASSLEQRDRHPRTQAYFMWWKHYALALSGTLGKHRLVIDYDRLIAAPEVQLRRLAAFLGREIQSDALEEYVARFLDQDLRHTVFDAQALADDARCPLAVLEMSRELEVWAGQTDIGAAPPCSVRRRWSWRYAALQPSLRVVDAQRRSMAGKGLDLEQYGTTMQLLDQLRAQFELRDRDRDESARSQRAFRRELEQRDQVLREIRDALAQLRAEHEASLASGARRQAEAEQALGLALEVQRETQRALDAAQQANDQYRIAERHWEETRVLLHYSRLEVEGMRRSRSWRISLPLRIAGDAVRWVLGRLSASAYRAARRVFKALPLDYERKQRLKSAVFAKLGGFLRNSMTYKVWAAERHREASELPPPAASVESTLAPAAPCGEGGVCVPFAEARLPEPLPARLVAFYLPQFHPIPENDAWWGKGFTEWTNVTRAAPQFEGHYQPHLPADLGFYDLRVPEIQAQQVELAKTYGLSGFAFYFYWFGGKRLLEAPVLQYLENRSIDFPFCLCWANENWSRRWDGRDQDVLIAQAYSDSDDQAFIGYVAQYLRDPRYLRIDGRPLLLVYRPGLLPDARRTAARWRDWCRANGLGEIYLAYTQSFEAVDPAQYGFDAAIEFPPNNSNPPLVDEKLTLRNPDFKGIVYDWRVFVERSREYRPPAYRLFRGVCPSWDNEARRPGRGVVFQHASPSGYREWLGNAIADTRRRVPSADERLVFLNAWNEWAEGAHLEPDQRYGFAWLQATRDALIEASKAQDLRRVVVVSHDAHPHGAQYLSLHLSRVLHCDFGYEVDLVLLGDGVLREEMARTARVHDLSGVDPVGPAAKALARDLREGGADFAIVNTTVSGLFLATLSEAGMRCISLIHELPGIITTYGLQRHARSIAAHARQVVFASEKVAQPFRAIAGMPEGTGLIRPQGLYKRNARRGRLVEARAALRDELGVARDAQIVLGVGYADRRKGVDLFVQAALQVAMRCPQVHFVWVGHWEPSMDELVKSMLSGSAFRDRFHFLGRKTDTDLYYAGADVYALSSREDPFPTVIMEALEVGVPVVAFRGTGGGEDLLVLGCGRLVTKEDAGAFAEAIVDLLANPADIRALGDAGRQLVAERFSFRQYVFDLLEVAGAPVKRVSVAVPNYNYGRYLAERLSSIAAQTYPVFELLILDDASQDDSLRLIEEFSANTELDCRVVVNKRNSGSVFRQWQLAAEMARGEFLWICEADDVAEPEFLARVLPAFDDPKTVLSYCQSKQIDEAGRVLAQDYLAYTDDICAERWRQDFVQEGCEALASALAVKNTIPNVSAAVFPRQAFLQAMKRCQSDLGLLRVAGDWLVYSELLREGKLAFCAEALNRHRRHQAGVTISNFESERHLTEILFMQERMAAQTRLSENTRGKALAFARQVQEQFGLTGQDPAGRFAPLGAQAALRSQQTRETAN